MLQQKFISLYHTKHYTYTYSYPANSTHVPLRMYELKLLSLVHKMQLVLETGNKLNQFFSEARQDA